MICQLHYERDQPAIGYPDRVTAAGAAHMVGSLAVPIFEYQCQSCGDEFEALVRAADVPSCPGCGSQSLNRLLTSFAVSSAERSQRALSSAREAYRRSSGRTDRLRHEAEEVRDHLQEDYGVDARTGGSKKENDAR